MKSESHRVVRPGGFECSSPNVLSLTEDPQHFQGAEPRSSLARELIAESRKILWFRTTRWPEPAERHHRIRRAGA